jgi:hypothetical protein
LNPDEQIVMIEQTLGLPPGMLQAAIEEIVERKLHELLEKRRTNGYDLR